MSAGAAWTPTTERKSLQTRGRRLLGAIRGRLTHSLYEDLPPKSSQFSTSRPTIFFGLRGLPFGSGLEELLFFGNWLLDLRVLWRAVASVSGVSKENGCLSTHARF